MVNAMRSGSNLTVAVQGIFVSVLLAASFSVNAQGFDSSLFQRWNAMRVGSGEPVYWYSQGSIRAYPGGELLATMEGYDTARLDAENSTDTLVRQLSRKIYVYRDAQTGEVLRLPNGEAVAPIAYPYQYISYELKGDLLETYVEQGAGASFRRIGPGTDITAETLGAGVLFSAPLFLDFEVPGGRYQTFEHYDFFSPNGRDGEHSFIVFVRYGDAPEWAPDADKIVMHMTTERFDKYADVPAAFRNWVEANHPLWREPPRDAAEIKALQSADD